MSRVCSIAMFAALLGGSQVLAQEPAPAPPMIIPAPPPPPRPVAPKALTSPQPAFPEALRATGAQGDVGLGGVVRLDGTLIEPVVTKSSRVPEFDQLALDAFRTWTFKPGLDVEGKPMEAPVSARITFSGDTIATMTKKTCAEFVRDHDWFRATWPEPEVKSPLYYSTLGLFTLVAIRKGSGAGLLMVRAFGEGWEKTYKTCRKKPDALYLTILAKAI
ncbi:MAG: energy transducer TonB [Caulobacter sp.]|nr:energy transducer TonB [Caulobacter sp.]